jgi:hypothetical protein
MEGEGKRVPYGLTLEIAALPQTAEISRSEILEDKSEIFPTEGIPFAGSEARKCVCGPVSERVSEQGHIW